MLFSGPEILGPHNDVGKIVRSLSGPETPGPRLLTQGEGRDPGNSERERAGTQATHLCG